MSYVRGLSRSGWVLVGIVAALIIAPTAAVAATVLILHGANGPAVNATNGNQLLTAEAPPSSWVSEVGFANTAGVCENMPIVSRSRGFIVKQVNILASGAADVFIYLGPNCNDRHQVGRVDLTTDGNEVYPFDPGVALPTGGRLSVLFDGSASGLLVHVLGYTVPASDARRYTPVLFCSSCG